MLLPIPVVTADGKPVNYARATGRCFAEYLSAMVCYIGFILAFFDDQRRTLHDRICNTLVIVK